DRLAGSQVEMRSVPRALDRACLLVEHAVDERPVVVRAAILDRVDGAGAVEDADLEVLPFDQAHRAGRKLSERAHGDGLGHGREQKSYWGDRISTFDCSGGRLRSLVRVRPGRGGAERGALD